ncbi:MAG: chemotaxis protein CheX [Planctomycetota bacterium]|nr:chemotaxis protein CheX [Planctomycetota bacterium]
MSAEACKTLETVFPDILQQAAFAFGEPSAPGDLPFPEDGLLGGIRFSGSSAGSVQIAAPTALAGELAANALGLEPGDELVPGHAEDALRELLNIVCGNLLTAWAGEKAVFDLTPPEVAPLTEAAWKDLAGSPNVRAFIVDGMHSVMLRFNPDCSGAAQ